MKNRNFDWARSHACINYLYIYVYVCVGERETYGQRQAVWGGWREET